QRVAAALEIVSRRNASAGDDRDAVLLQFVESDSGSAIAAVAHAYASTLHPAVDAEWDDATDALNAAQNLSQICANLVTLHWARPKLETNVIAQPAALVELLMALSRDPRYTVSSLALTSWASLIKHSALCRVPAVAASFSALTESTTEGLFQVCRAAHLLAGAQTDSAGIDEAESDQFDSPAELRLFLNSVVRMRMLNIIRGMCALDPAGFVQWIMPSLLPVFSQVPSGPVDVGRMSVVEAAFMIVDSILTTLDETEQRALENGSEDAMDQIQKARGPCYQLGQQIVQLASDDTQLLGRQLQTLPSFTFLLRPAAMEWTEARELLLAVLQRCATCLKFPLNAPNVRDLRQVARRATAALVRIAVAIPDSLMLVYADLQQLVQDRLSDPEVVGTVKSHLTEFQLALIAGASCTLAQRRELARPVIQPLIDELCEYLPHLQSPADFIVLLGLPALDQACVQGVESPHAAMDEARVRRNGLSHVLSTLFICLNRTLGDQGTSEHSLAPLWSDYVGDVVPVLLLTIRSLHALWNPEHWQGLPWQSAQARSNLFGLLEMSPAERQSIAGAAG
ncbi:karyopherin, partial [Coemansia biformis]